MFIKSVFNFPSKCKVEYELHKLYEVKDLLGKGGNGEVYAGIRKKDGKEVAIKRIKKRSSERRGKKSLPSEVLILQQVENVPVTISS